MARSLDTTDKIAYPAGLVLGSANPFTIAAWFYAKTIALFSGGFIEILSSQTNGRVCFQVNDGEFSTTPGAVTLVSKNTAVVGTSTTTLSLSAWHHIGCSYDGTNWKIFIDGAVDNSGSNVVSMSNASDFVTGNDGTNAFQGNSIADLAVWNVLLTAGEFNAMFRGARPPKIRPKSFQGYWPIDGNSSPEPDFSGNAFNGTLAGTSLANGPPVALFTPRWPQAMDFVPAPTLMGQICM